MKATELQEAIDSTFKQMQACREPSKEYDDAVKHLKVLRSVQTALALESAEFALDDTSQYHQRT